ncbi:MAG: xanthine dehydrogenase family protein molybdopterin-binding subunit, partial [Burkholderiales bacterium]
RSPYAHAKILKIDGAEALEVAGVLRVLAGADLAPHCDPWVATLAHLKGMKSAPQLPLPLERATWVGEAVAGVVAESRALAEDAVARVKVDYAPLPAVSDCRQALAPGAPLAHRGRPSNLLIEFRQSYGDVAGAFARAPHRAAVDLKQHRGGAHSIEGRGALAAYDANEDRLTLWSSTQLAHEVRAFLMRMLRLDENQIRVVAPDVGGGFGTKFVMYPEEVTLATSCLKLRRPIKWIEDRREHFVATSHERVQLHDAEIALTQDGRIVGIKDVFLHDTGAYDPYGLTVPINSQCTLLGQYDVASYHSELTAVFTNKTIVTPYRGAGRQHGIFVMERLLDIAARELGMDRNEIRRRNFIPPDA